MSARTRYNAADKVARASLELSNCLAEFADLENAPLTVNDFCQEYWDAWGQRLYEFERAMSPNADAAADDPARTDGANQPEHR